MRHIIYIAAFLFALPAWGQILPPNFPKKATAEGTDEIYSQATGTAQRITFDTARTFFAPDIDLVALNYNIDSTGTNIVDSLRGRFVIDLSGDWWYVDYDKTAVALGSGGGGGSGETNTMSNVGDGTGIYYQKSGVQFQLKSLKGGGINSISSTDSTVTITATEIDGSITNELDTLTFAGDSGSANIAGGETLTIAGAGIASTVVSGATLTVTATEVDGSTTNELGTVSSITYVPDTTSLTPKAGDAFINTTADTLGLYDPINGWVLFFGGGGGSGTSIFKQENTSTAATAGTTNNYHTGNLAIGDFSGTTTAAGLHLWRTDQAVIRLSDSSATDTAALAWLEFYRGIATNLLGKIGYTDNTDADLYITNSLSGGGISFGTDAIEKMRLAPSGQLTLNYYGDTTFTGTAVKYLGVTDAGAVIEVDGSSGGSGDSTAFSLTQYTADGTTTVDFQSRAGGYFQIDMGSTTEDSLTFSNPASSVVPTYRLHWQNVTANSDTVTFPANVLSYAGDTLGSRELVADSFLECYYDGSNYYCSDTIGASVTVPVPDPPAGPDSTIVTSTSGLIVWYNINRETEYTTGSAIDTIHDWSGLGHHIAAGVGERAAYQAGAINGTYPIARFDGSADYYQRDSLGELASGNDFTVFIVAKNSNLEDGGPLLSTMGVNPADSERFTIFSDTRAANKYFNLIKTNFGPTIQLFTSELDTTLHTFTTRFDFTTGGGDIYGYVDGTQQGTATAWTYTSRSYYNTALELGSQIEGFTLLNGDVAEVIIYNRLLSEAEADDIESYLSTKYGHY